MGNSTSQTNARGLREELVGIDRIAQHAVAYQWAKENGRIIDMFGAFSKERHLLLFQSGNEFENWIDPVLNIVYKMNNLMHVGGDICKLLERIEYYNDLFPETALRFVGLHPMSSSNVYPVFAQPFISDTRFATVQEIDEYMHAMGFNPMQKEGYFENELYVLADIKPKNVLCSKEKTIFVIDAEISKKDQ